MRSKVIMTSLEHHPPASLLLVLMLIVTTWSPSEAMTNDVSRPRDNSLARFISDKDSKSDWPTVGDRGKVIPASWTPVCRNYSCSSPPSNPGDEGHGRAQQTDSHVTPAAGIERPTVTDLMRSVSAELSGLRSALQHLKLDSQAVHRQIKRLHRASCAAARRARRRTRWTGSDDNKRLPDAAEYSNQQLMPVRHHHHRRRHHHSRNRCPFGFIYSPAASTCYLLRGEQVTWDAADRHCRRLGSQLVTIQSAVEQRQITELARTNSETAHCNFWIGLRRSRSKTTGGSSSWQLAVGAGDQRQRQGTSNVAVYGHWNTGEPNDAGGNEDCAQAMWVFSWRWNDTPCQSTLACYACQTSPSR